MATTQEELDILAQELGLQLKELKRVIALAKKTVNIPLPLPGWFGTQYGLLVGTATASLTPGRQQFHPFFVGDPGYDVDQLGYRIATAGTSGATSYIFALYEDIDGVPNTLKGPIATTDIPLTSSGNLTVPLSVSLKPGIYWVSYLLPSGQTASNVAISVHTNTAFGMPVPLSVSFSTAIRGYVATGRTTLISGVDFKSLSGQMGAIGGSETIQTLFRRVP